MQNIRRFVRVAVQWLVALLRYEGGQVGFSQYLTEKVSRLISGKGILY